MRNNPCGWYLYLARIRKRRDRFRPQDLGVVGQHPGPIHGHENGDRKWGLHLHYWLPPRAPNWWFFTTRLDHFPRGCRVRNASSSTSLMMEHRHLKWFPYLQMKKLFRFQWFFVVESYCPNVMCVIAISSASQLESDTVVWDLQRDSTIFPVRKIIPLEVLLRVVLQPLQLRSQKDSKRPAFAMGKKPILRTWTVSPSVRFELFHCVVVEEFHMDHHTPSPLFLSNSRPSASKLGTNGWIAHIWFLDIWSVLDPNTSTNRGHHEKLKLRSRLRDFPSWTILPVCQVGTLSGHPSS